LASEGVCTRGVFEKIDGDGLGKEDVPDVTDVVGDVEEGKDFGDGSRADGLGGNALNATLIFATSAAALFLVFIAFSAAE